MVILPVIKTELMKNERENVESRPEGREISQKIV